MISANDVREVYCYFRRRVEKNSTYGYRRIPQWDGGIDKYGNHHKSIWESISEFLQDHNCENLWGFMYANFRTGIPYPTMLKSDMAWKVYEDFMEEQKLLIPTRYQTELDSLLGSFCRWRKMFNSDRRALKLALADRTSSLSPLFKFLIAEQFEFKSFAKRVREEAAIQFNTAKTLYQRHWPISSDTADELYL